MRILMVEDNADHRELMSIALTGHDPTWQVEEVASGEEALRRLAEEEAYDLVLLDYSLPQRNGLEVLEEIQRGEAPPPVVVVTGRGDEQVAVEAMKAGAYDYVVKVKGYLQRLPVVAQRAVEAHQLAVERKRAEEALKLTQAQLLQAQKLESIGRLAGGIAHDFNNLLTTIRGFASLVLMDTPEDDPRRQDLQRIVTAADRAAGLTRQLTLFGRREPLRRQPLRLNRMVQETYELLKETFPRTIEIKLALEPEVWPIEADPAQMSQVLMNLCVNARDAMPEGGVLTLETRNVTLDEEYARTHIEAKPGPYVRLSVSDTGVGMSREVQAHLFEPFFTTKEVGEGIGLGLPTVYGIVKAHEGFITVYSEVGRGSTFHIYLPATEQRVEVVEESEAELPRGTETVLLVDDEEALLELGRSILERCGYRVLVAQNGAEALEAYQGSEGEIALVVLDLVMPEMDGRGCLLRLLEMDPEVRVLIATGYTVGSSARALLREGALGVVEKPYRLQELSLAVREALDADRTRE